MFDLKVLELKESIIQSINESGLPASVVTYIVKEIVVMAEQTLQQQLQAQMAQKQEEEAQEEPAERVEATIVE